ncbi:S-layer homology domain-containing protein [Candidatus Peribacteria bacterium]|nr:S-layer homology domain-containing protein [Candidatus Peribacteria bacterium]
MPPFPPFSMRTRISLFLTSLLLLAPSLAMAIRFPDVPTSNAHRIAIEELSDLGVISGNPDSTFRPTDPVNRAAMLKMAYIAAKMNPEKAGGCFTDVQQGSWYEYYVCDAAANGFVKGYGGGLFKPAQPVTRAEAMKIVLVIFGIADAGSTEPITMYNDVATADWFAGYVRNAIASKILPISGQEGPAFMPNKLLERGEAAAYIWNAIGARGSMHITVSPSSSSSSSITAQESIAMTEIEKRAAAAQRVMDQEAKALEHAKENTRWVNVPFTDKQIFDGKTPFSYEFVLNSAMVVDVQTTLTDWTSGGVSCRLYLLGRAGFSQEYYLGFQDGKNCVIHAALSPGNWHLQLEPEKLAPTFSISVKQGKGDGNDGFSQAATLPLGQVRSDGLEAGDLEDWYTFSVPRDAKTVEAGGREMVLRVSSSDPLGCLIYPMDDVDQYGFRGPDCGYKYVYPPGTYMASVRHAAPLTVRQTYSIQVK